MKPWAPALVLLLAARAPASAQFRDDFDSVKTDPEGIHGWRFFTGDGTASMDFRQGGEGHASILVDATTDKRGIWWARFSPSAPPTGTPISWSSTSPRRRAGRPSA